MGEGFRCGDGEMRRVVRQDPLTCNVARRRGYPKPWWLGFLDFPMFLEFSWRTAMSSKKRLPDADQEVENHLNRRLRQGAYAGTVSELGVLGPLQWWR